MIKSVIFDLDGTLLPMNDDVFVETYFRSLCKRFIPLGYDKDELISTIWAGTKAMIKNDGSKLNETVFWETFTNKFGKNSIGDKSQFDEFYLNEFKQTKESCGENEFAKLAINLAKEKGLKIILASNPVFPIDAMLTRLGFINLERNDFDYITHYSNSHFAKPNSKFFEEILMNNNLKPNEVIVFGNSEKEDIIPAEAIGLKSYLVGGENGILFDEIINIIKNL